MAKKWLHKILTIGFWIILDFKTLRTHKLFLLSLLLNKFKQQ